MGEGLTRNIGVRGDVNPGIDEIYFDNSLVVLNKPAGLLAVPGRGEDKQDCLSRRVQQQYPDALIVHRLDMATSGLMLMARGAAMQRALSKLFENREVYKRYVAVVDGNMGNIGKLHPANLDANYWDVIDLPINVDWPRRPIRMVDHAHGKPSQTRWRPISFDAALNSTRVELQPITGRSHQLRVHLQALGHPILGDMLYAPPTMAARTPRLCLHACTLEFLHPVTGTRMRFESGPDF